MVKQLVAIHVALRGGMKSSEQWSICRQHQGGLQKGEIHVIAEDRKIRDSRRSFTLPTRQLKIDQKQNPKGLLELTALEKESGANFIHFNIFKSFSFCPESKVGAKKGRRPDSDITISRWDTALRPQHWHQNLALHPCSLKVSSSAPHNEK